MHTAERYSKEIDRYLNSLKFPQEPQKLYEPIEYTLEEGGKRLRPTLMLIAYGAIKGLDQEVEGSVLAAAAAVELFHNFTLMHDDIMDNADVRRGKESVYKRWGNNRAILSGDAMVISAYVELSKVKKEALHSVMTEFNRMALGVCEGQQYDIDFESREDVSIEEYKAMVVLKTASIFSSAAKIGGIIAGATREDCQTLYNFGDELGVAFQLQDDYLDVYGTEQMLGKKLGGDIEESKKTYLTITALEQAGAATKRAMLATFKDRAVPLDQKIGRVKTIYNSMDVPQRTKEVIESHLQRASQELDKLSVAEQAAEPLREIIERFRNRNR